MKFDVSLTYEINSKSVTISESDSIVNLDFPIVTFKNDTLIKLEIDPKREITLKRATVVRKYFHDSNDWFFLNGYQSWTDTKEFIINEKMKSLDCVPKIPMKKYAFDKYEDAWFKYTPKQSEVFYGYTYSHIRKGEYFSLLGAVNNFNSFTTFTCDKRKKISTSSTDIGGLLVDKKRTLLEYISVNGGEEEVFDDYRKAFKLYICRDENMVAFTSWYKYYHDINEKDLINELESASKIDLKLFQIADGCETFVGDWLDVDYEKFTSGLKNMNEKIHEKDMLAGVWVTQFICEINSKITTEHDDWIVNYEKGKKFLLGSNWSGFYALDIFNPEVEEHIKKALQFMFIKNGFDLLKLDFSYVACFSIKKGMSRGEVRKYGFDLIKKYSSALLLGCGVPLASATGMVDYCRICTNISLEFDDVWFMRHFHRERIFTKVTLVNMISKRHLDHFFLNAPEIFLMREDKNKLYKKQRNATAIINFLFGSICLTSDTYDEYIYKTKTFYHILNDYIRVHEPRGVVRINDKIFFYMYKKKERGDYIYNFKKGTQAYVRQHIVQCRTLH